jgi:RNA polymerase sigma factor (sigma-70 family)
MSAAERAELLCCYHECDALLRGYVGRRMRRSPDSEDVVQEVYVRLARLPSLAGIRDSRAFVIHAAKNLLRDRLRRTRTRASRQDVVDPQSVELTEVADVSSEPSLVFESLETLREVGRVLDSLKADTRRAFWRHRIDARPHADVAAEMGISVSMVEKHVKAAGAALRSAGISPR